MRDEIIREEVSSLNKNEPPKDHQVSGNERMHELPRMYGSSDVAVADTRNAIVPAEPSSSSGNSSNETRRQNLTKNMRYPEDNNNDNNNVSSDDDPSTYMSRLNKPKSYDFPSLPLPVKYDFQNLGTALPLVLMPTATVAAPAAVNPIPPPSSNYYTINDPNSWRPNYNGGETYSTQVPNSDYFVSNPDYPLSDDYYYPIICGVRNNQQPAMNRWATNPYMDTSNLGYAAPAPAPSPQPWVVPYNNGNYYTSLQPQNFYTNVAPGVPPGIPPQFICKRDCTPTTRFPTTRCTRRPGSPQPVIAWENNNTCCCELCGVACKGQFNRGKGPQYGPCKPAPLPMPNNRNALYCHGRRRKREYYLSAPKARQRLQRESDRCRITTTTTAKPRAWPTNYPVKFKLQKSIDATSQLVQTVDTGIPVANQVSHNVPMSPAAHQQLDRILIFENQHQNQRQNQHVSTSDKIQVVNENKPVKMRSKKVPETASSKLRKKHNEIRMQELQETLEIALERMNQEMNQ